MKISKYKLYILSFLFSLFIFSNFLLLNYTSGDQTHYIKFYNTIKSVSYTDIILLQKNILDSVEFVFGSIIFIGSNILNIDKNIFISFFNCLLAFLFILYFYKKNVNLFFLFIIASFNFYFLVLYSGAERLKFGAILFLLSLLNIHKKKYFVLFMCLSLFSHMQFLFLYVGIFLIYFLNSFSGFIVKKRNLILFILSFVVLILVLIIMKSHILNKFVHYFYLYSFNFISVIKNIPFLLISVFYCKNKIKEILCLFSVVIIASFLIGSDRLVLFSYFIMLNYILPYKRGFNAANIITISYFSYKGFNFIYNILKYGDGFAI